MWADGSFRLPYYLTDMKILLIVVLIAMSFWLYRRHQHDYQKTKQARLRLLDEVTALFDGVVVEQSGLEFPQLKGFYKGFEVKLNLVEDSLAVRKIPPLWLMMTVQGMQRIDGSLDMIVRPQNNEFYSPAWQWEGNLQAPAHWPQHSIIKFQDAPADVKLIDDLVPSLFEDAHAKELLITPWSVRLTYMAKQAERGEYLIMRNTVFNAEPLAKEVVMKVLNDAITIRVALEKGN